MKTIFILATYLSAIFLVGCKKDENSDAAQSNISDQFVVSTFAGSAQFNSLSDIAIDTEGNVYVADKWVIRKISPAGNVTTLAGDGSQGYVDGQGSAAKFDLPYAMTIDGQGNIYVVDRYKIRKVTPSGMVTTLAGTGERGNVNGEGTKARFNEITGIAADKDGNVYVIDNGLAYDDPLQIRKITPSGVVSVFAGRGHGVEMSYPLKIDGQGNLYLGGGDKKAITKFTPSGQKSTYGVFEPGLVVSGMDIDSEGNIYFTKVFPVGPSTNQIYQITPSGKISTLAGTGKAGYKDGAGNVAEFNGSYNLALDPQGNIYVIDSGNNRIRKISK